MTLRDKIADAISQIAIDAYDVPISAYELASTQADAIIELIKDNVMTNQETQYGAKLVSMDRLTALKRLEPLIENGTAKSDDFAVAFTGVKNDHDCWARISAERAYHGSLDAAKTLKDGLLPDWAWCVEGMSQAALWFPFVEGDALHVNGEADNPARAWLLAEVRALIVKLGGFENE